MSQIRNVVFVAPFFQETTLRLMKAVARLPGVRLGLISQDPVSRVPADVRAGIDVAERVDDGLDTAQIGNAIGAIATRIGPIERIVGALEELQVPLGDIRDQMRLPGMGGEAARNFRDKARMKSVLQRAGIPCARHLLTTTPDAARAFAAEIGYPLVAKPPAGSGARATFRLETAEDLEECLRGMPPHPERPLLLEEFVTGREFSFDSVSLNGDVVWHSISHYSPTPLEVLQTPWVQWTVMIPREIDRPEYAGIRQAAIPALPTLGLRNGLSHMEWFLRPDGRVAISEVGARPPGAQFTKLISYAHDFDLYAAWARLMVFDEFSPRPRPYAAGAAYLRAQGKGDRIATVAGLEEVFEKFGSLVTEYKVPQPGQPASGSYEGEGYVILRHPETDIVEQALRQVIERVRVLLK